MQWVKEKRTGFTIVELLIVIVVIAILAAITIVAYTGIQDRATQSSLQSSAKQAYTNPAAEAQWAAWHRQSYEQQSQWVHWKQQRYQHEVDLAQQQSQQQIKKKSQLPDNNNIREKLTFSCPPVSRNQHL